MAATQGSLPVPSSVPRLLPFQGRLQSEPGSSAHRAQPGRGDTPTRARGPSPRPGGARAAETQSPGSLTWRRPGACFPRGAAFLSGGDERAKCFPPPSRRGPPPALALRAGPRGAPEGGWTRHSSPRFPPRRAAGSPLPSPHPVSAAEAPLAGAGQPGLRAAPPEWAGGPGGRRPPPRGAVRARPRGKGTRSLSRSWRGRLLAPRGGRRRAPPPPAAPPASCHRSPALQRLTFEFVIGFGLFVKLLPDFEIRHDPRFRLHGSRFPSCPPRQSARRARAPRGRDGAWVPRACAPAQCPVSPLARAAARPARGVYRRPRRAGPAAARLLGHVVRRGRGIPGSPGEPCPRRLQLPEGQAGAEATWWTPLVQLLSGFPVNVRQLLSLLSPRLPQGYRLSCLISVRTDSVLLRPSPLRPAQTLERRRQVLMI